MQFSFQAISRALIEAKAIATEGNNELEKFLLQQNIIQFKLARLIELRAKIPDKDLINWVEQQTLGTLIQLYKICAVSSNEISFIRLLKEYNQKRNYLIHRILKNCDYKKLQNEVKNANTIGLKIIKQIEEIEELLLTKLENLGRGFKKVQK